MPQQRSYLLVLGLSEAELRTFEEVLDYTCASDDADLVRVVGPHHQNLKTARRMHTKIVNAIADARAQKDVEAAWARRR